MTERRDRDDQVDRYVRGELSETEAAEFELALMEDPGLQDDLEASLAIRRTLEKEAKARPNAVTSAGAKRYSHWMPLATAASVFLAVVTTALYWRAETQVNDLEAQLDSWRGPQTSVLQVPVNIMRSAGQAPDVVVQKPLSGLILLDIELPEALRNTEVLHFELTSESGRAISSWSAAPQGQRRATVALNASDIPEGLITMTIRGGGDRLEDTRLLEFRSANGKLN